MGNDVDPTQMQAYEDKGLDYEANVDVHIRIECDCTLKKTFQPFNQASVVTGKWKTHDYFWG